MSSTTCKDANAWPGATMRGPLATASSFDDVKFGFSAIRERYKESRGRMLRCIDPFSLETLVFSSPLQYENWLDRRFNPSIVYVDSSRDSWEVLHHGQQLSIEPHLCWAGWSNIGVLELVVEPGRQATYAAVETLETIARAHHMKPSVRMALDIRRDTKRLNLLDRIRQTLVNHSDVVRDDLIRDYVLHALKSKPVVSRGDLMSACVGGRYDLTRDAADAVLFWLRQVNGVQFEIAEGRYDDLTAICAA